MWDSPLYFPVAQLAVVVECRLEAWPNLDVKRKIIGQYNYYPALAVQYWLIYWPIESVLITGFISQAMRLLAPFLWIKKWKMAIFYYSDDESFSDFDGFTYDDILGETSDLNERENNSSDVDFSSDSDDLPLSRLRNGHDNGPNEGIEHDIGNRTTSWSSALTDIGVDAFVQPVGAVNILANDAKEIKIFEQIFPNEWYLKIAQETNRYT